MTLDKTSHYKHEHEEHEHHYYGLLGKKVTPWREWE